MTRASFGVRMLAGCAAAVPTVVVGFGIALWLGASPELAAVCAAGAGAIMALAAQKFVEEPDGK